MKTKFFYSLIIGLGVIFAGSTINSVNGQTEKKTITKETVTKTVSTKYTCPEHPDVVMDKPGKCPKCGMALVEKKMIKKEMKKEVTIKHHVMMYTCPEHPDVVMNKAGKCPKCGMALVEKKEMMKKGTTIKDSTRMKHHSKMKEMPMK